MGIQGFYKIKDKSKKTKVVEEEKGRMGEIEIIKSPPGRG
jgi:hypothetical protein